MASNFPVAAPTGEASYLFMLFEDSRAHRLFTALVWSMLGAASSFLAVSGPCLYLRLPRAAWFRLFREKCLSTLRRLFSRRAGRSAGVAVSGPINVCAASAGLAGCVADRGLPLAVPIRSRLQAPTMAFAQRRESRYSSAKLGGDQMSQDDGLPPPVATG